MSGKIKDSIGWKVIGEKSTGSTNEDASTLVRKGKASHGMVVRSAFQHSGKGHDGHVWQSERNKNLLFSIILFPENLAASAQFYISKFVSLAICDWMVDFCAGAAIKWPNDIYCRMQKIAGILIENDVEGDTIISSVAGCGINVNQTAFDAQLPNPGSLRLITGSTQNLDRLFTALMEKLNVRYGQLLARSYGKIDNEYRQKLFMLEEICRFRTGSGHFEGRITGVERDGRLIVLDSQGKERRFAHGEVHYEPKYFSR